MTTQDDKKRIRCGSSLNRSNHGHRNNSRHQNQRQTAELTWSTAVGQWITDAHTGRWACVYTRAWMFSYAMVLLVFDVDRRGDTLVDLEGANAELIVYCFVVGELLLVEF
ncbi:hypothetical protein Syun_030744 [Stephania yunnanensis]|uniref:Uncharacterized protein n=1 Tax=Stephania yunnanensis TaxID=152371 RepID=A0AAP0DZA7_9MAGN